MKIAILGWGSLIWDPRNLEIDESVGKKGWAPDGPTLPIEFSRISQDGRLTLVIDYHSSDVPTLYAVSNFNEADHAISNLAAREGCGKNRIGFYLKENDKFSPADFQLKTAIKSWIEKKVEIDAVIWTNLLPKLWYEDKKGNRIDIPRNGIIDYLSGLSPHKQAIAEEYIRKSPPVVDTPVRREIESELGWTRIYLP